jgi:hypothetical protein
MHLPKSGSGQSVLDLVDEEMNKFWYIIELDTGAANRREGISGTVIKNKICITWSQAYRR